MTHLPTFALPIVREILALGELELSVQLNFKFDMAWMMAQYPEASRCKPLFVVHGFDVNDTTEGGPWYGTDDVFGGCAIPPPPPLPPPPLRL